MELTNEIRDRIREAIVADRENYPSDSRHSVSLGISASVYNAIKKGNYEKQVSDANWICIARRLGVVIRKEMEWTAAETPTFLFINEQLALCQQSSISAILCDLPNIGKTFTARIYAQTHRHAVYVDCSQVKSKQKLIQRYEKRGSTGYYSYDGYFTVGYLYGSLVVQLDCDAEEPEYYRSEQNARSYKLRKSSAECE